MIVLKTYNKYQLKELIDSEEFNRFPFIPISVHRADSHIHNPAAGEDDTLLILAFDDGNLAGYIGILPGILHTDNEKITAGWLSTIFVHPDYRGKKIAQKLLYKACDEYSGHIIITEFTPEAGNMYLKSQLFVPHEPLKGKSYHFFSDLQKILPAKNKKWSTVKPALKLFDNTVNFCIKAISGKNDYPDGTISILNNLDEESSVFIEKHSSCSSFNRGVSEINWITGYPWILNSNTTIENTYQFSDFEKKFEYVFIKIYDRSILVHVLMLSVRNSIAKLHFVFGDKDFPLCASILKRYIIKNNISNLISFDEQINMHLDKSSILFKKDRYRHFLLHKELCKAAGPDFNFSFTAGDGDTIFT